MCLRIVSLGNIALNWVCRALSIKMSSFFFMSSFIEHSLQCGFFFTYLIMPYTYLKILTQHLENYVIVLSGNVRSVKKPIELGCWFLAGNVQIKFETILSECSVQVNHTFCDKEG